jgi:hypothetical protein
MTRTRSLWNRRATKEAAASETAILAHSRRHTGRRSGAISDNVMARSA